MTATLEKPWPKVSPTRPGASLTGVWGSVRSAGVDAPDGALEATLDGALDDLFEPFWLRLRGISGRVGEVSEREESAGDLALDTTTQGEQGGLESACECN